MFFSLLCFFAFFSYFIISLFCSRADGHDSDVYKSHQVCGYVFSCGSTLLTYLSHHWFWFIFSFIVGTRLIDTSVVTTKNDKPDPVALQSLPSRLLDMVNVFKQTVATCFNRHKSFERSMTQGLVAVVNKNDYVAKLLVCMVQPNKIPPPHMKYVQQAKYLNDLLQKGSKTNVSDLESTLNNVVSLYTCLQDKDVFECGYQNFLAKRLLDDRSSSEHLEKSMVAKLNTACGYQWYLSCVFVVTSKTGPKN